MSFAFSGHELLIHDSGPNIPIDPNCICEQINLFMFDYLAILDDNCAVLNSIITNIYSLSDFVSDFFRLLDAPK